MNVVVVDIIAVAVPTATDSFPSLVTTVETTRTILVRIARFHFARAAGTIVSNLTASTTMLATDVTVFFHS